MPLRGGIAEACKGGAIPLQRAVAVALEGVAGGRAEIPIAQENVTLAPSSSVATEIVMM